MDRFGVSLKCCSALWRTRMVVAMASFLAYSYFKIKNEMVRIPYKLVNVLSFETYLKIVSFRLLENQTY